MGSFVNVEINSIFAKYSYISLAESCIQNFEEESFTEVLVIFCYIQVSDFDSSQGCSELGWVL
jgi:hypothetical protein